MVRGSFEGRDWVEHRSTKGLVPYRKRRAQGEDREQAERWARGKPWYGRVVHASFNHVWVTWWCTPATAEELESIRVTG